MHQYSGIRRFIPAVGLVGLWAVLCLAGSAAAAAPDPSAVSCRHVAASNADGDKRVAIIIGNGAYGGGIPALPNPANDAKAVSQALADLGFETFAITDAAGPAISDCLSQAYAGMAGAAVGLVYYSGHGIQIRDENYLVATNATASDLKAGLVPVQPIVDEVQKNAAATLVFLDACRNNPMAGEGQQGLSVSTGRGLARVDAAAPTQEASKAQIHGLLVAYATSPNSVALDGTGDLSPFTSAFVKTIRSPGYSIQHVMEDVTKSVGEDTAWAQTPWTKSSLTEELKLTGALTLEDAQAQSDHWADISAQLLHDNDKTGAIAAALKGIPASADPHTLELFPKAYEALYAATHAKIVTLPIEKKAVAATFSPGDEVAVIIASDDKTGSLELWSTSHQARIASLGQVSIYPSPPMIRYSPSGGILVLYEKGVISAWSGKNGSRLFQLAPAGDKKLAALYFTPSISSLAFSPDEKSIVVADNSQYAIRVIDAATGKTLAALALSSLTSSNDLAKTLSWRFHAEMGSGNIICISGDNLITHESYVLVYHLATRKLELIEATPHGRFERVFCDPGEKIVGAASTDGFVVWDMVSHKQIASEKGFYVGAVMFDTSDRFAFVDAGGGGRYFDVVTWKSVSIPGVPENFEYGPPALVTTNHDATTDDESLLRFDWGKLPVGSDLVEKAMTLLSAADTSDLSKARIAYRLVK